MEAGDTWPAPVPKSALGADWITDEDEQWTPLVDEVQSAREDAFFRRLLHVVLALWPDATYLVEYPYGDGPRQLVAHAGGSALGCVVRGALNSRAIDSIVECTPQPVVMEIAAGGVLRVAGEPWQGVGLYLSANEVARVRTAVGDDDSRSRTTSPSALVQQAGSHVPGESASFSETTRATAKTTTGTTSTSHHPMAQPMPTTVRRPAAFAFMLGSLLAIGVVLRRVIAWLRSRHP